MHRLLPLLSILLCLGCLAPLNAARRSSSKIVATIVVSISDAEVLALLTPEETAQWQDALKELKEIAKEKSGAQWLLERKPGEGAFKIDVSESHAEGKRRMDAALKRELAANQLFQNLRETAQKRADERAAKGPQYVYTDSTLEKASWNAFAQETGAALISELHAANYYAIYYAGVLRWKDGAYAPDADANTPLLEAMMRADGRDYSLIVVKNFSVETDNGLSALKPEGFDAPKTKAAVIVAEIVERANAAPVCSVRAVDYATWKILSIDTRELADAATPAVTLRLGDEKAFLSGLAAGADAFLFQLSFTNPEAPLARECAVLAKDALSLVSGVNLSDGDFFAAAYAADKVAMPSSVNALFTLNPETPPPEAEVTAAAEAESTKNMSRAERAARRRRAAEEAAQRAEAEAKKPTYNVLIKSPLSAVNLRMNATVDFGVFEATTPKPPKAEAPAEAPAK